MRYPHFFKAYSRLGLKNIPHRQTELNFGVEKGPDAILTEAFLSRLSKFAVSDYIFKQPENLNDREFNKVLGDQLQGFIDLILSNIKPDQTQVIIGGDHSVTFSSIAATLERFKSEDVGYIHIDSHPDANLSSNSPTQNFHGMYLRPFITNDFDIPEINELHVNKLQPENMLFIGNLDIDEGERFLFDVLKIRKINPHIAETAKTVSDFTGNFEHLHVNLDIDVFDKTEAPATGIPAQNGMTIKEAIPVLEIISKHPSISFDLVEVNPQKDGSKQTIKLAQEVLKKVLW